MNLKQLQDEVDAWIKEYGVRYFDPMTNMAILTEEVGELARVMSRTYGEQSWKEAISSEEESKRLADEMADVLWVLSCLANQTSIDLSDAIHRNFQKKLQRDSTRHLSNDKLK